MKNSKEFKNEKPSDFDSVAPVPGPAPIPMPPMAPSSGIEAKVGTNGSPKPETKRDNLQYK